MKKFNTKILSIKGALLDKARLCSYLEKLASEQITKAYSDEKTYPIYGLKENFEIISNTYNTLNQHVKLNITIDPAGEWILDNFYIIEEVTKSIIKELTPKKYKNLIGIGNDKYNGFARIYVLASEIMAYTDGKIEEENIKLFLKAYQSQKLLTIEEIWMLPIFLQISAIQNIREICDRLYASQIQKYKAESIIERLVEQKEKSKQNFGGEIKTVRSNSENISFAFVEYLSYKLKSYGKKGIPYLQILEEQVNKMGTTIGDIIKNVHYSLASNKVSMGNCITTIKEISHIDFVNISKQIGGIEEILKQDPAGVYDKMDYKTKNDYQNQIQKISRKTNISEVYIAKTLIDICNNEKEERKRHVGYFLEEDTNSLYKKLEINKKCLSKEEKAKLYMAINILLPMFLCFCIFLIFLIKSHKIITSAVSAIILYLPLTEITTQFISYILGKLITPKRLPKLDFSLGVPKEAATFVVIPTILKDRNKVREIMHKLEVYYLANKSDNLYFALLGDVTNGKDKEEDFDKEIIQEGIKCSEELNHNYPTEEFARFHFLYRKREWNPKEECYLGWERKRGLLNQFNEYLLNPKNNEFRFNSIEGSIKDLPEIKYIITLDADTNLTLNSGLELIGTMEHILNKPVIQDGRVVIGHGIIQPRIGVDLNSYNASVFSKIYSIPGGTDLYTNAISDVYQDNFDEGIFTGKGIYNLKVFSEVLKNQIPENTVLSHDLLEGSYLRCGLASDILLLDGFPSKYNSYMTRLKRWIRGDWQIIQWMREKIKIKNGNKIINPLNPLSKYKILDNIRRSLIPIGIFITLLIGMLNNQTPDGELIILGLASSMIGIIITVIDKIIFRKEIESGFIAANKSFLWKASSLIAILYQNLLDLFFLPFRAYISFIAITKTLYRVFVSKKNLLEWLTAEEAEKQAITSKRAYYRLMIINVISGLALLFFSMQGNILQKILGFVIGVMWLVGPAIACDISKSISKFPAIDKLKDDEKKHLLEIAKMTWGYFESFITEESNFLPPDNFEEYRTQKIAYRTSPTNIGLGMLSVISAIDFKFISLKDGIDMLYKMISTVDTLCKWNGHLYNWYDIKTLEPLNPKYISSVDSGNFIGYLYVIKQFLLEEKETNQKEKIEYLINKIETLIKNTDFSKLYDEKKKLFSIGFNLEENKLTDSYYDLLASEARQTSLVAIAKRDIPEKHWSALGRTLTVFEKYKGLVSWSGTAFEYLMPNVIIKNYPGSLIEESCKFMVLCQREYCNKIGIPWGISEAAFSLKDLYGNYQYKAFGIPWLGLKRGLAEERVVSSYGSILALPEFPREVMNNIKILEKEKMLNQYGLYESIDYTTSRLKVNKRNNIVKTYMAHHQALILLSINNLFHENILVSRFMRNPEIEAVDILLQERMPKLAILTKEKKEKLEKISQEEYETYSQRVITKPSESLNVINVISSDSYMICSDDKGKGYSKYKDIYINKFKEGLEKEQGIFFYIKNIKTKRIWSTAKLKYGYEPEKYKMLFMPDSNEISRLDGNIQSKTKITIAPDESVEIRELSLKNVGITEEILEISGILEPAISSLEQEIAHPVFNDLFLSFEWNSETEAIIIKRKKRNDNETELYLGVTLYAPMGNINDVEYEIDKSELIGRCNLQIPDKIEKSKPFSNKIKLVTEGIAALRRTIKIEPDEENKIALIISISENRNNVINAMKKYRNIEKIETTFELSRAKNEEENRYLGISDKDTDLYQKMLGYLLFVNPLKSLKVNNLPKRSYTQEDLWGLGISGDIPILLIKIKDPNDSYAISDILKAKEFFNLKNCKVDIVILNEEKNVYEQYVKEKIENAIIERHLAYLVGKTNGIFIINSNELKPNQRDCLIFRSNLVLDAGKGKLKEQIEELEESYLENKKDTGFDKTKQNIETSKSQINLNAENLKFYNDYGGFNENGTEYVLKINEDNMVPIAWSQVLSNPNFGTIVTENLGGFTWSQNSRLNRLSSWNNMPNLDIPSEILYIKEKQTGKIWSNSSFISKGDGDFKVSYGFGSATYTNICNDFLCETNVFVPKQDKVKISLIKLKNTKADKRNLRLVYYIKPVLGEDEEKTKGFLDLKFKDKHTLCMKNLGDSIFDKVVFAGTSENIISFTGDKDAFLGKGNILNPDGINKVGLDEQGSLGKMPCIAFEMELEIDGYESKEISIFFGETENEENAEELSGKYFKLQNCYQELQEVKKYWFETLNRIQVKTPSESMNIMLNGWLLYQTISCRLWAKSGYYQSGGAYGFRDQLQDTLGLKLIDSSFMKEQIIKSCNHQFLEGDVEHWWHEETNRGIRTRFSDDLLWLPYVCSEYINTSGDYSILDEKAYYLQGEKLPDGTDEKYDKYFNSSIEGTIYEHCIKAIDRGISLGKRGLPKIGSGDWNDGFNKLGHKGEGESIWLGFFLYDVLTRFVQICIKKEDREKATYYEMIRESLKKALNTIGWDGRWYKRAFSDDGETLGTSQNEECKIDSISQTWSVISHAGENDKKYIAMENLENYLVDSENGIIKLLTPPFENTNIEPGYIKSYMPGVRENGGQYTHAAAWVIIAEAILGFGDKATEYFKMINPIEHTRTKDEVKKYKVEPFVIPGDVYAKGNLTGRGGWTWYTGSSSWMYTAGIEAILGLHVENNQIWIEPNIPVSWKEYTIRYKYKDSIYHIKVKNPNGKTNGVSRVYLNGKEIENKKLDLIR